MFPNPIAHFYEAQAAATAEIVRAALSGAQRIQQLTLQMMRSGAALNSAPSAEQGARFQQEVMQAFAAPCSTSLVRPRGKSPSSIKSKPTTLSASCWFGLTSEGFALSADLSTDGGESTTV